jgi:hypothetical protein
MRGWLLASVALLGCSPFEGLERDRAADLAAIAARPPAERGSELRDRVLRDALNGRIRSVKGYATVQDPLIDALVGRLPLTLAEDYVALGDALAGAGDRDGALAAYQDALVVTARAGRDPAHAPVRQAALRGVAATWKSLGQEERGRATTILADADALHPAPRDGAAFVVASVLGTEMPAFKRLASAPALAGARSGPVEGFVATEVGGAAAALVIEGLELLRAGAPARRLEDLAVRLTALAPPAPPPAPLPAPSATDAPGAPSATPVAPPAAAPPAGRGDVAARLKKLDELHRQKLVTDAEYMRERARILKEAL